jgi:citrate lyase subunit beta/citryl-CoA lyase
VELLRTMLFVPGNRSRMIEKAKSMEADAVIFDLEDAVPVAEKDAARRMVREALEGGDFRHIRTFVRVNALSTGLLASDLETLVSPNLSGIVLPKTEDREEVETVHRMLAGIERQRGMAQGHIAILPIIETVRGVLNLPQIVCSSERFVGLAYGAEDFATDLGVERSRECLEGQYPRTIIALYARMANIIAVDSVFADINDDEGLERETLVARQLGYRGKLVIHPKQIEKVNRIFTPSDEEIERARQVVAAFEEAEARGEASVTVNGKMVDIPIAERARRLLAYVEAINKRQSAFSKGKESVR